MVYFSLVSIALGIQLLGRAASMSAVVLTFLMGALIGHFLRIDQRIGAVIARGQHNAAQNERSRNILSAFTLYCVSTSGVLGAFDLGFSGDATLLITRAIMDLLTAAFFAASCGASIAVIAAPMGMILAACYLVSSFVSPHLTAEMIGNFSAFGGMIQLLNGLRMLKLKDSPVLDLLPGMVLVFLITAIWPF